MYLQVEADLRYRLPGPFDILLAIEAARLGADVATVLPATLKNLVKRLLTNNGLEGFVVDWRDAGQTIE